MQILKSFIDSQGRKQEPGGPVPDDYDKQALEHYERYGMVGEPAPDDGPDAVAKKPAKAKQPKPDNTQATGPQETKSELPSSADDASQTTPTDGPTK